MSDFEKYYLDTIKYRFTDFNGRARRSEYWFFTLFHSLFTFLGVLSFTVFNLKITGPITILYVLVMIIPYIALKVRRLHDTGKSGWVYLISIIPFGGLVLIVFYCIEGDKYTNKWGPDPKQLFDDYRLDDHLVEDDDLVL